MGFWTGKVPGLAIFNMHLLFDGKEHFYAVEDDPEMVEFLDKQLQQKANTKLIAVLDYGQNGPIATVPIRKMEDLKGLKIRGDSEYATHFMKSLGAAPVLLSSGEVYDALSKKVIDGAICRTQQFHRPQVVRGCLLSCHQLLQRNPACAHLQPRLVEFAAEGSAGCPDGGRQEGARFHADRGEKKLKMTAGPNSKPCRR